MKSFGVAMILDCMFAVMICFLNHTLLDGMLSTTGIIILSGVFGAFTGALAAISDD